ncbi:glutathione S-transferase [Aspergillus terreus]|uniref:Glutathione S-transferase n=1 Tax=Aspergillus terreus TaxID=33178 RepID=A0A5M3YQD9_ASPTE|nr:hypothetical protein ATETN484_0002076100 [Aspergillus terreus]GFF15617.1 glutathione S-transferase [Aspergillus terreus]
MVSDAPKVVLYRGWPDAGKYVWSPFVVKLEARLRFAGISYTTRAGSLKTAPKGKIPYVEISEDDASASTSMGDSTLIIKYLIEQNILPDLNGRISPTARAHDLALRALMEEKLYFYHMRERWVDNYYLMRDHVLSSLPYPVRVVVGLLIYRNMAPVLHGQGTGRHTRDESIAFRREIWESINDLLVASRAARTDDEPFWILAGSEPTEADCTVFGFIVSVMLCTA